LRQTRKTATPIRTYRVTQAGANNQFGGVKDGFARVSYHVGIAGIVKIEPIRPAHWQATMLIANLRIFLDLSLSITHLLTSYA
jgi:hypothetical protein